MLYLLLQWLRGLLESVGLGWLSSLSDQVAFRALAASGAAFGMVLLLGRGTIDWLIRLKVGDSGVTDAALLQAHAATKANTPTAGGVLICGAILASTAMLSDIGSFYIAIGVVVVVWLSVVGGVDDWLKLTAARRGTGRQGLLAWEKLAFQVGLGVLVGMFAYEHGLAEGGPRLAHVVNVPWQRVWGARGEAEGLVYLPRLAFVALGVLLITGMSNAVNITDGMDGLVSGVGAAVAFGLVLLCLIAGDGDAAREWMVPHIAESDELAVMAGAMGGACLGFLWWNCQPARVFMGDTGSLALGGLIGYIALVTRQEFIILLMCGVFVLEIASVVIQVAYFRMTGGRRVFRMAPYHHHLHLGGWTESQTVQRLWIVSGVLLIAAMAIVRAGAG